MTSAEAHSFDLAEEMVQQLEQEYGPEVLRGELEKALAGGGAGVGVGLPRGLRFDRFFADFGRRWMERTLELGERYADRTYQVLRQAAKETEELSFPFIPQRFIEIAYLSTQPIYTVPIVENGARGLVFKMPFCGYFKVIQEVAGEEFARELHCKNACLVACRTAFGRFGFNVGVTLEATMPADEYCQFAIRRA